MVTSQNLSAYEGTPPSESEDRKIPGGPIYDLTEIQELTKQSGSVNLWTEKCRRDAANLALDTSDLGVMICELVKNDYRDSEWCSNGKNSWAACDAYTLKRIEFNEPAGKMLSFLYFLKFAKSKTGKLVLIVSCHMSG